MMRRGIPTVGALLSLRIHNANTPSHVCAASSLAASSRRGASSSIPSTHYGTFLKRRPKSPAAKAKKAAPPAQPYVDVSDELFGAEEEEKGAAAVRSVSFNNANNAHGTSSSAALSDFSRAPLSSNLGANSSPTGVGGAAPWDADADGDLFGLSGADAAEDEAILAAAGLSDGTSALGSGIDVELRSAGGGGVVSFGEEALTKQQQQQPNGDYGDGVRVTAQRPPHVLAAAEEARQALLLERFFAAPTLPSSCTAATKPAAGTSGGVGGKAISTTATSSALSQVQNPSAGALTAEEGGASPAAIGRIVAFVDAKSDAMAAIDAATAAHKTRGEFNKFKHPLIAKEKAPASSSTLSVNIAPRPYRLAVLPSVSSVDLQSSGAAMARELVPALPAPGYVADLATAFTDRKLRNEPLLKAALWRTFKWDYLASLRGEGGAEGGDDGGAADGSASALVPSGSAHGVAALANLPAPLLHDLTAASAQMFALMGEQSMTTDKELVFIAVGRLVECAPFMLPNDVAAVLGGLRNYGRTYLSLSDVLLDAANHDEHNLMVDTLGRGPLVDAAGPQGNVIDFLLDALERQISRAAPLLTAEDVLSIMEGLAHSGVRDPSVIRAMAEATARLEFTPYQAGKLLQHTASVHERLVSLLVGKLGGPDTFAELVSSDPSVAAAYAKSQQQQQYPYRKEGGSGGIVSSSSGAAEGRSNGGSASSSDAAAGGGGGGFALPNGQSISDEAVASLDVEGTLTLCAPLFIEAAKKVNHTSLVALSRDNPMLIIELRRMCEANALITARVPQLWDAVRHIHIPNRVLLAAKRRTEFGATRLPSVIDNLKGFKVKSVVDPLKHPHQRVPNAFRKWEQSMPLHVDPRKTREQRRGTPPPERRCAFGVRRITKQALVMNEAKRTRGMRPRPQKNWLNKGNYKPQGGGLGRGE